jgi:hypothetical protein
MQDPDSWKIYVHLLIFEMGCSRMEKPGLFAEVAGRKL